MRRGHAMLKSSATMRSMPIRCMVPNGRSTMSASTPMAASAVATAIAEGIAGRVRSRVPAIMDGPPGDIGPEEAALALEALIDAVVDVIVGTELLKQARADERRFDLAASWINRSSLEIEANTRRIAEGTVARVERCEKIVDLAR